MAKQDKELWADGAGLEPGPAIPLAPAAPGSAPHSTAQGPSDAGAERLPQVAAAMGGQRLTLRWRILLLALLPAVVSGLVLHGLARLGAGLPITLLVALALAGLGIAYAMHQAQRVLRPIRAITAQSDVLTTRYSGQLPGKSRCELGAMARSFDALTGAIERHTDNARQMYEAEVQNSLDLQRQYALMQMLRNLASAANNGEPLQRALENSLREIGSYLDWPVGRLVLEVRKSTGEVESVRSEWYAPNRERFSAFIDASNEASREAENTGLIGLARESNLSHWISDLGRMQDWPRRGAALACGLRTGFVIPISAGADTAAFVEYFADHRIEAGAEMLELVEAISVELWSTANRYQSESSLRSTSTRARRLASIAESMEDAVAVTTANGRIEWANGGLTRLVGYTATQTIGKDIPELLFGAESTSAAECLRHLASGAPVAGLVLPVRVDGARSRWYELEIQPMADASGGFAGSFVIVRDVTGHRTAQSALREDLERARQASQSKSQFLANMSHEIRTPMNGVLGMTELLLGTDLDERQRRFLELLHRSAESLLDIINDILDLSKIEAGKLALESIDFDLRTLIEDVVELLAPRAHQKRIELAYQFGAGLATTVRGDPTRLRQILLNIVGNAIKFTERGEVTLTVEALASDPALPPGPPTTRVRFVVRDSGVGMRPEAIERLFSVYMQADQDSSRRYGGSGLGLAICAQLTELMNGQICASSRIGEGSVLQVELPLQHGDPSDVAPKTVGVESLVGKRVLIAEDNPTNRRILSEQLLALSMDCALAENGRQALQMLRIAANSTSPFDVAIVDMKMPIMDGMDVIKSVRAEPALCALRLVLLTSIAGRDDAGRAHAIGVDAYLSKPVRQRDLISCLAAVLESPAAKPAADQAMSDLGELAGLRVLAVEDNPMNQEVAAAMLAEFGCDWKLVDGGAKALELLERERFDVVLLDCGMPTMDGFETVRRLRDPNYRQHDLARVRQIPVIALTANALHGEADRCRAAGFSDYLAKPFRRRDLREVLLRWTATGHGGAARGRSGQGPAAPGGAPAPVKLPVVAAQAPAPARTLPAIAAQSRQRAGSLP